MRTDFVTAKRGLDRSLPPMRLYELAKKLGVWNPADLDLTKDKHDWANLTTEEKDLVLRLLSLFVSGEEAVTLDLLPLIQVIASEGRLEEEIYLTTFLFEEAKHTDFFRRFLDEVVQETTDLSRYHTASYRRIFYEELPAALLTLQRDPSPEAQVRASVTYNMIVEGVLAETGYYAFLSTLKAQGLFPGLCKGIGYLKRDESRHIAYGLYLISRLLAENPNLWPKVEGQLNTLLPYALGVIQEAFAAYTVLPLGLEEAVFITYATNQFAKRLKRLERAREGHLVQEFEEL